ncbi:MAG: OPT/YSL family transporter [Actinobacteria bacterium]|nr:OPT/YSL family transporter [Actinomycetota bacterium]
MSVVGAIIGLQVITTLGVTPNTSIIGVLVAIVVSRIPGQVFNRFRSVHRQNLVQSTTSAATFGAANSLILPIGIPVLMGRPDLLVPMIIGATMAMFIDWFMLYWVYDSRLFPGAGAWPPGVAAAEAIIAGDQGGRRAGILGIGVVVGIVGNVFGVSGSAFGVAFIGNIFALTMFGVGLLIRGYGQILFHVDMNALYIPHGMMIGAGLVALIQVIFILLRGKPHAGHAADGTALPDFTRSERDLGMGLARGFGLYMVAAVILAAVSGIYAQMGIGQMVLWVVFAAVSCIAAEMIVGLSAMHAGWFPAFATALIFLVLGMLMGFPAPALGILVGFVAAGSPSFADAGYDLRTGYSLRGMGRNVAFERDGRWQQIIAGLIGLIVAWVIVTVFHDMYFSQNLFAPVDRVYAATIKAGVDPAIISDLLIWAIPGAIVQAIGGPDRQMGILLATGLLIVNPLAGWAVLAAILIRIIADKVYGKKAETPLMIFGAGCIAGDALWGFGTSVANAKWKI